MDKLDWLCVIAAAAAIMAAAAVLLYRRKTRRIVEKLVAMLDSAINGHFSEHVFDESVLSAVEAKMARFLLACAVSSKNLTEEKNKIEGLISDISHQTKTPVSNLLLYSQLLCEHELPEDCAVCTKALSAQAEKLNFLIGALVKISRLETGIITVKPQKGAVQKLLDSAVSEITPKSEARSIIVETEATDCTAYFDMKWTAEAVYNIIDNAVKYSPPKSTIQIRATPYELFSRIDITDEGMGIREEEQGKIFSRFYRSPAVSDQDGVGIGLYLTREIISAEGGYIKVSSKPGQGSVFSIFLPTETG